MKTLAIIPARGGSKRVPGKNKRLLQGKPLVTWVIEAALNSKTLDRIVVSSDDDETLDIAGEYEGVLPIRRPAELSDDTALAIDYVRHSLAILEKTEGAVFDAVVILQPSSPLTRTMDIDATVRLLEDSGADSAVSVVKLDHAIHPAKLKEMRGDQLISYIEEEKGRMAEHELPPLYVRNCSVYATRMGVVGEGKIIGDDCRGYIMPREFSIDINDETDMLFAEFLLNKMMPLDRG